MHEKTIEDYKYELRLAYKGVETVKSEVRKRLMDLCISNPEIIINNLYGEPNVKLSAVLERINNSTIKMPVEYALERIEEINGIISKQS